MQMGFCLQKQFGHMVVHLHHKVLLCYHSSKWPMRLSEYLNIACSVIKYLSHHLPVFAHANSLRICQNLGFSVSLKKSFPVKLSLTYGSGFMIERMCYNSRCKIRGKEQINEWSTQGSSSRARLEIRHRDVNSIGPWRWINISSYYDPLLEFSWSLLYFCCVMVVCDSMLEIKKKKGFMLHRTPLNLVYILFTKRWREISKKHAEFVYAPFQAFPWSFDTQAQGQAQAQGLCVQQIIHSRLVSGTENKNMISNPNLRKKFAEPAFLMLGGSSNTIDKSHKQCMSSWTRLHNYSTWKKKKRGNMFERTRQMWITAAAAIIS